MSAAHLRGPAVALPAQTRSEFQCARKLDFQSEHDARRWSDKRLAGRQRPYACPHCGAWHLTSQGVR